MSGQSIILAHTIVTLGYLALAWYLLRLPGRPPTLLGASMAAGTPAPSPSWAGLDKLALPPLLALHFTLMFTAMWAGSVPNLSLATSISALSWLALAIYWLVGWFHPLQALLGLTLLVGAAGSILPLAMPSSHPLARPMDSITLLHIGLGLLAYALFILAVLQALLVGLLDRRLHSVGGHPNSWVNRLPPLLPMEKLLFQMLAVAFALLTVTLVTGAFYAEELFGRALPFNHKTVFTLLSWITFAVLLYGRFRYGWRGRLAQRWIATGAVFLLLAYLGSKFVSEILLGR